MLEWVCVAPSQAGAQLIAWYRARRVSSARYAHTEARFVENVCLLSLVSLYDCSAYVRAVPPAGSLRARRRFEPRQAGELGPAHSQLTPAHPPASHSYRSTNSGGRLVGSPWFPWRLRAVRRRNPVGRSFCVQTIQALTHLCSRAWRPRCPRENRGLFSTLADFFIAAVCNRCSS